MPEHSDSKKISRVIARSWLDKDYHERLLREPHAVLTEAGITVKGKVHVHQNTEHDVHLVLPQRPATLDEHVRKQHEKPGTCADAQLCSFTPDLCSRGEPTADLCSLAHPH